jgi:hypothetical protein
MCAVGFVGPDCNTKGAATAQLSPNLLMTFSLDNANPQLIHFRLDSTQSNWISFMIINDGTYKTGDSATAYKAANGWIVEDQTGHSFQGTTMSDNVNNGQQNLMNPIAWQPTPQTLSAQWSRLLNTGDAVADMVIKNG